MTVLTLAGMLGAVGVVNAAAAAVSCRIAYAVTNQWSGGFGASVTVHNLGDPLDGWRLVWTFGAGQTVTQLWNGTFVQSGGQVTVADAGYNGAIPTNGSTAFGFNGGWNSVVNPVPASFALNGVTCTGAPAPTTPPPTGTPPPTSGPTTAPTTAPTRPPGTPPAAYPGPGRVTGDTGVHDPAVVKSPTGGYILVATGDNLAIKTSGDRTAWRDAGPVWPSGAPWTVAYTGGGRNLWAPDISYRNGQFYLYYSASTFGSQRSAIFLATSPTGASGSWTDRGLVIESSTAVDYNAIDPNLVVDAEGQWWLSFGSFWSGLKLIRLDPATGRRSTTDTAVRALATRPSNVGGAVEAPTIHRYGGYYYLFASFDRCCQGAQSTYRIMVGRSRTVTGPYLDRNGTSMTSGGGTQVLAGHGSIHGPGHQAVIADSDADVLFYHYYADNGAALLGINLLGWDAAGWPYVY
ncbi:family 43 glycosylhydrolase [Micromonospora sp. NBC_01699]|uniref:family 43 glycosylhydrolase n=1 Tax=Micromonospora sp. NBC_01699 TaxID=2975984 RepID=UPI002E2967D6|nr:family 43 glycosylhydrolase [Micromonospora sp. NBC_01699]